MFMGMRIVGACATNGCAAWSVETTHVPNRLLSKVIVKNTLLDALHNLTTKKANHRQVHTGIHQPKRISSGDDAIKRRQIFKSATYDLNFGMIRKSPRPKGIAELFASIYENQAHGEGTERPSSGTATGD